MKKPKKPSRLFSPEMKRKSLKRGAKNYNGQLITQIVIEVTKNLQIFADEESKKIQQNIF